MHRALLRSTLPSTLAKKMSISTTSPIPTKFSLASTITLPSPLPSKDGDSSASPGTSSTNGGGIEMPRIHLGVYCTSGRETSNAVTAALKAGYRAFDSAEWYDNEKEVGDAITKFLSTSSTSSSSKLERKDIWFTTKLKSNVSYDETRRKIKQSIKECGLGYLDLYLLHSPYGGKRKRLECWRAVEDAIEMGEVRVGGVSNYGVKHVSILSTTKGPVYSMRRIVEGVVVGRITAADMYRIANSFKNSSPPIRASNPPSTKSKSTPSTPAPTSQPSAPPTTSSSKPTLLSRAPCDSAILSSRNWLRNMG